MCPPRWSLSRTSIMAGRVGEGEGEDEDEDGFLREVASF